MPDRSLAARAEMVAKELSLPQPAVARTLELLDAGATVPFIARYRKEITAGLDDGQIQRVHDRAVRIDARESRRSSILESLRQENLLTPDLERAVRAAKTLPELEDLYLPYRPRRRTRAQAARERGLSPLAELILSQPAAGDRQGLGSRYLDPEKGLPDLEAVFQGARDIVAETVAERAEVRAELRRLFEAKGEHTVEVARGKSEAPELARYRDHLGRRERATAAPSHRLLAAERGEAEGVLKVRVEVSPDEASAILRARVLRRGAVPWLSRELELALVEARDRLLLPSLESELRRKLKERADEEAIRVFAQNLENVLLAPPLGPVPVLAIDPGLRTGCKVAVLGAAGEVKALATLYMHTGQAKESAAQLAALVREHAPAAIAIGNGTAGRETESFVQKLAAAGSLPQATPVVLVSEAGASVYSASELAREELPELDVSLRGAVSIGRRLQDPLAELVKIDPRSIGVGQYQHDVDQSALAAALDRVVERAVNRVGVDLNTASPTLLRYVAGLGPALARAVVAHRAAHGRFSTRVQLKEVPRLGAKAFEQCAGFLRIQRGSEPLDSSGVHPERYTLVARMAKDLQVSRGALVGNEALVRRIEVRRYVDDGAGVGLPTLEDIVAELQKPGRDPRAEFSATGFDANVKTLADVKEGMTLNGIVTNVAAFGAFVDVGVHQDGLVHVSELANRFVKDPAEVVKAGDRVRVKVLSVDHARKRIGLSIKALQPATGRSSPAS